MSADRNCGDMHTFQPFHAGIARRKSDAILQQFIYNHVHNFVDALEPPSLHLA